LDDRADSSTASFTWRAHPAAERRGRAVLAALAIVVFCAASFALLMGQSIEVVEGESGSRIRMTEGPISPLAGLIASLIAGLVLLTTLHRFFFPSQYTLCDDGITVRHLWMTQTEGWDRVASFRTDERGGFLATTARQTRLGRLRGMHLQFGSQREEAIARIRAHLRAKGDA
jgi:hypothetical protein